MVPRRRYHPKGSWRRDQMLPEDLAKGLERDRARFLRSVLINPGSWTIARTLRRTMPGETGEGLRGIFLADEGEHGVLHWWPSHAGAHFMGAKLLGIPAARYERDALEVEVNIARNGTVYLAWNKAPADDPRVVKFHEHPTLGGLMDGCLTHNGRQLRLGRNAISLHDEPVPDDVTLEDGVLERRQRYWTALAALCDRWARSRRRVDDAGRTIPAQGAIAPLRIYALGAASFHPEAIPLVEFPDDQSVTLRWRHRGDGVAVTFRDHSATWTRNRQGRHEIHPPHPARTRRQMNRFKPMMIGTHLMVDHDDTLGLLA